MTQHTQTQTSQLDISSHRQAWEIVTGQLQQEMARAHFENWVKPLNADSFQDGKFVVSVANAYARDWVDNRLKTKITRLLEGIYRQDIDLEFRVNNVVDTPPETVSEKPDKTETGKSSSNGKNTPRKMALQRAYGDQRAAIIQPERSLYITNYLFSKWLPLLGHSAFALILAARSMCYWNPMTGELRNDVETDFAELAKRAAVSVRTAKTVLNEDLVRLYFMRYKPRRMNTPNGVRTAGIYLQVRMDDPLTPQDQEENELTESEEWFTLPFEK